MGISLPRSLVIDLPTPILREEITLFIRRPTGTAPNVWVYVMVFGMTQWTIILILLVTFVIGMTLIYTWREGQMRNLQTHLSKAIGSVYLFTIQQGEHPDKKHFGTRIMTLTTAMFTLIVFIYYANDITAEMTAGPPQIPIKTFEDVINHDYRVIAWSSYLAMLLASAKPGTPKHEVYQRYFAVGKMLKSSNGLSRREMMSDTIRELMKPKTLFYSQTTILMQDLKHLTQRGIVSLKMDDASYAYVGFGLQKNSEFLDIMNYFILKEMEHGILMREMRNYFMPLYTNENFEMVEPQPLSNNNTMFVFICLGVGIIISLSLAILENTYLFMVSLQTRRTTNNHSTPIKITQ